MDERSIDKAPSASLDMMALNKTVVNARGIVRKAKSHLINKLVRNVTDLKKKKGSEQQKEKNLKKAQRFLEEIDSMRTLKDDKIFKYALANVSKFEEVAKTTVSPATRAMARLADHRLVKEYVQKFRIEQSDWRDLAAFMLMKQTGRKFKTSKQKDKAKGKKERKEIEKVNRAENVRASKFMTEVYTHGLFRDDEFQKAKETVESDSKGELNFLQKRRLRIANEKKEKQKLNSSENKKLDTSHIDSKVKHNISNDDAKEGDESEVRNDESDEELNDSEEDVSEKIEITESKKINNNRVTISDPKEINDSEEEDDDDSDDDNEEDDDSDDDNEEDDDDDSDDDNEGEEEEEEEMEVSNDDSEEQLHETKDKIEDDDEEVSEAHEIMKKKEKKKVEPLKTNRSSEKDKNMKPPKSNINSEKHKVEPLMSKKNSEKNTVEPLGSKTISKKSKECVVKQLNIGSMSDASDEEEDSDVGEAEVTDEEEKPKQPRRMKRSKPAPKFLTEEAPNPKKLPKDSFFEGGDFDESDSDDSEKEKGEEGDTGSSDNDDDSQEIVGNRGKIKSMIYNGGYGAGRGRGRGRGRGGGNNNGSFKFGGKDKAGKTGKKPFGRGGGGGDGPFSFGCKEVMYKRRNQTLITEEGKTKLVTEAKTKESKPQLHPSWEASRKRKAEESGGIKAFAGKRISFGDD